MLNRMLRYADAIVKSGIDKLIDTIAHNPELQAKNAELQAPNATSNGGILCYWPNFWQVFLLKDLLDTDVSIQLLS